LLEEADLQFLRSTLRSVWALELMLFIRAQADRSWTAEALTLQLRASLPLVTELLQHFERLGLVLAQDAAAWKWQPASAELSARADAIANAHARTPFQVINAILDTPNERLRTFADAFKLRKGGET
jgi:hypothetical protein